MPRKFLTETDRQLREVRVENQGLRNALVEAAMVLATVNSGPPEVAAARRVLTDALDRFVLRPSEARPK